MVPKNEFLFLKLSLKLLASAKMLRRLFFRDFIRQDGSLSVEFYRKDDRLRLGLLGFCALHEIFEFWTFSR